MEKCILCGLKSVINRQEGASRTIYNCKQCGVFVVSDLVENEVKNKADEIKSYLMTRKLTHKDSKTVLISYEKSNLDKDYQCVTVGKIVDMYPKNFSEQMKMALKNIGYMSDFHGHEVRLFDIQSAPLFYIKDENPAALLYLMEALRNEKLIDLKYYGGQSLPFGVTVSPKGWEQLEASERYKGARDTLFAYSAGGDEKTAGQFHDALEHVAQTFDYHLEEDSGANVTFDIVSSVKSGGITVCDFSGNAGSAYYAAAMAQGLGRPCILTCHESAAKKLQFNTSQFRVILWDKQETLYAEIVSTIKATV